MYAVVIFDLSKPVTPQQPQLGLCCWTRCRLLTTLRSNTTGPLDTHNPGLLVCTGPLTAFFNQTIKDAQPNSWHADTSHHCIPPRGLAEAENKTKPCLLCMAPLLYNGGS